MLPANPASPARSPACILLTATVQVPQDMAFTARRDTATRWEDYKQAFSRWMLAAGNAPLILVENSGYDLSELRAVAAAHPQRTVELLSFQCPPYDGSLGKGYGEMLCLEHCLAHSEILQASSRFLKVTGRYFLSNAQPMLDAIETRTDRALLCNLLEDLTWADSRVFGGDTSFLRDFLCPMRDQLNDTQGVAFENVLARAVHSMMSAGGRWALLPEPPHIVGTSGSLDKPWKRTKLQELKQQVRFRLLRYLLRLHPE